MKINVSLDDELLNRIDAYADVSYMTRSGFISLACFQYLNHVEMMGLVKDMGLCMRKIADSGTIDDESMRMLQDFEGLCRVLSKAE